MKLVSLNVCGLVEIVKQQQIRQFITENSVDVLFLQETNVTNTNFQNLASRFRVIQFIITQDHTEALVLYQFFPSLFNPQ